MSAKRRKARASSSSDSSDEDDHVQKTEVPPPPPRHYSASDASLVASKLFLTFDDDYEVKKSGLIACLSVIVSNETFKKLVINSSTSRIKHIIHNYEEAGSIMNDFRSEDSFEERVKIVSVLLAQIQEKSHEYLQTFLKSKKGEPYTALWALSNLINHDRSDIKEHLSAKFCIRSDCSNCYYRSISNTQIKPIISLSTLKTFQPECPIYYEPCLCKAEKERTVLYKLLPPCLIFHFQYGAGEGKSIPLTFNLGHKYHLTAIIVKDTVRFPERTQFITFIREPSVNMWLNCDSFNSPFVNYSDSEPAYSAEDVYIAIYQNFYQFAIEPSTESEENSDIEVLDFESERKIEELFSTSVEKTHPVQNQSKGHSPTLDTSSFGARIFLVFDGGIDKSGLISSLSIIAYNKTFKKMVRYSSTSQIRYIIRKHEKAVSTVNQKCDSEDDFAEKVKISAVLLAQIVKKSCEYLQSLLKSKEGEPDAAFYTLSNLINQDKSNIREHLRAKFCVRSYCTNCGHDSKSTHNETIISLKKVKKFHPEGPVYFHTCDCKAENEVTITYKLLPPCLIFYFENGAGEGNKIPLTFNLGYKYHLTAIMIKDTATFPGDIHFKTFIREPSLNLWLNCDNFRPTISSYFPFEPKYSLSDVYMCVFENDCKIVENTLKESEVQISQYLEKKLSKEFFRKRKRKSESPKPTVPESTNPESCRPQDTPKTSKRSKKSRGTHKRGTSMNEESTNPTTGETCTITFTKTVTTSVETVCTIQIEK